MDTEEIKIKIINNKEKLSLIFNNSIIKLVVDNSDITITSEKYKDTEYCIYRFYKPITRMK